MAAVRVGRSGRHLRAAAVVFVLLVVSAAFPSTAWATPEVWFPVQQPVSSYSDTWGAPRSGGRSHEGTDILAPQMREVYAAQSGQIIKAKGEGCVTGVRCTDFYLAVAGDDGRGYLYIHLNNDTPGRPDGCDQTAGYRGAFSPRLVDELEARGTLRGVRVARGEPIGYVGSSGNAACGQDQLHFEIWRDHQWGRTGKLNPYPAVRAADDAGRAWSSSRAVPRAETRRDAGATRVETAVALSRNTFDRAGTVVIAPAERHEPALVAAPLAAALDAPVLLVWTGSDEPLARQVSDEVERLGASAAVLVGVGGDLPPRLDDELARATTVDTITRHTAPDVFALSTAVADAVLDAGGDRHRPMLALGTHPDPDRAWPDALAASVAAARDGSPVLLTGPDVLPRSVAAWLSSRAPDRLRIVGGPAAISPNVQDRVEELGVGVERLAGADRYETALTVAETSAPAAGDRSVLHIATGRNYPDALVAGPALARQRGWMVLVDGAGPAPHPAVTAWVESRSTVVEQLHALGGPAAISDVVLDRVAIAAGG